MSFWCRPYIAWIGRAACLVGLFIAASRASIYCVVVFLALYALVTTFYMLKHTSKGWGAIAATGAISIFAIFIAQDLPALGATMAAQGLGSTQANAARLQHLLDSEAIQALGNRENLIAKWINLCLDAPLQGYGLFTSTGSQWSGTNIGPAYGPHNLFVAVWADAGLMMLVIFVIVLMIGFLQHRRYVLDFRDRLIIVLIWVVWILTIIKFHTCFYSDEWFFFWAIIWLLPAIRRLAP